jgi:hypothetical protein
VCNKPIELASSTGLCQTKECELYTKPVCDECVTFDFDRSQPDIEFHLSDRNEKTIDSFWNRFAYVYQRAKLVRSCLYLFFGFIIILAALDVFSHLNDLEKLGFSARLRDSLAAFVIMVLSSWALLESKWSPSIWLRKPKISLDETCPKCQQPLKNRQTRRVAAYDVVNGISPTRFRYHPNNRCELLKGEISTWRRESVGSFGAGGVFLCYILAMLFLAKFCGWLALILLILVTIGITTLFG